MLQIISGKFFKTDNVYSTPSQAIFYTNFRYRGPIITCVGTLEPVDILSPVATFILKYDNKIEQDQPGGHFRLVKIGDAEIQNQFMLLCFFGLRAFFSVEKNEVSMNCRTDRRNLTDNILPSQFVSRFFDNEASAEEQDIENFIHFVEKVISLPRDTYKAVMNCFQHMYDSLQSLNSNLDLSYSLIVYCLESLSQTFDQFEPEWEDYNQKLRNQLEPLFTQVNENIANKFKMVLLQNEHLRLQKRFIEFIKRYLTEGYFREEAENLVAPLKKLDIEEVIKNAYDMRSKYVHQLRSILKHLSVPQIANSDVFVWQHSPFLTYRGFVRLIISVLSNFIHEQPATVKENYNWWLDLPGSYEFEKAPQYWLHETENFDQNQASNKLEGLLEVLEAVFTRNEVIEVNLINVLQLYENRISNARKKNKLAMLAFYMITHYFLSEKNKRANYDQFVSNNISLFDECSIEAMILSFFIEDQWKWDAQTCEKTLMSYHKQSYRSDALKIPPIFETGLFLQLANTFLEKDRNEDKFIHFVNTAINQFAGKPNLQKKLQFHLTKPSKIDPNIIFDANQTPANSIEYFI